MALHPPAMGGKTAWGVSEAMSRPTDDPAELLKTKQAQEDFSRREAARLDRLKEMDRKGDQILADRQARRSNFQMGVIHNADEFKNKQLEILAKMQEAKAAKKAKKKEERIAAGIPKKKKKRKRESSSSSSSSESSSSSSSSDDKKKKKKGKVDEEEERKARVLQAVQETHRLEEQRRKAAEKQAEKEAKRQAKMQLAAWEAEMKRKDEEAKKEKEEAAKKKEEELKKKKAKEEAAKKAAEDKKKQEANDEEAAKKKAEAEARKAMFQTPSLRKKLEAKEKGKPVKGGIAGGYKVRDHVVAAQDITIRGNLVVMAGTAGTVIGPAESDPIGRVAVDFVKRQDGGTACLNCVPREIKKG